MRLHAFVCPVKPLLCLFHRGVRPRNNEINCPGLPFYSAIRNPNSAIKKMAEEKEK